tara:strand:- start:5105 stop:5566 length:462 start_codon:yes stop_codon:yes gene_type:complete
MGAATKKVTEAQDKDNTDAITPIKTVGVSKRAGLCLPVANVKRRLRNEINGAKRCSVGAAIWTASTVESVMRMVVEESALKCKRCGKNEISTTHIIEAVRNHKDLGAIFAGFSFSSSKLLGRPGDVVLSRRAVNKKLIKKGKDPKYKFKALAT